MGFFSNLWSGIKSVAGKVGDALRWGVNGVKTVAGKVGDGIRWVKNVAGKVGNIPIVGDILKKVYERSPIGQQIGGIVNTVEDVTKAVGDAAGIAGNVLGGSDKSLTNILGDAKSNRDRFVKTLQPVTRVIAPFRA